MSSLDRIKKKRQQLLVEGNKNLSSTDKSFKFFNSNLPSNFRVSDFEKEIIIEEKNNEYYKLKGSYWN